MTRRTAASPRRLAARIALGCAALAARIALGCAALAAIGGLAPQAARAQAAFMRIDGVKPDAATAQPLGPDAFPITGFEISVEQPGTLSASGGAGAGRPEFGDANVNLSISGPALALWQLAVRGDVVPRASLAIVDAKGLVSYRADLEQVMVKSLGMQTLGGRDAAVGVLTYGRIQLSHGGGKSGKSATTVGWDKLQNKPLQ
jgi:hypothetical protein